MNQADEEQIIKIGRYVAKNCWLKDKEEAYSIALLGIARGLNSYDPKKGAKLGTYLYACAKREVYAEYRKIHSIKRGSGEETLSIEELLEKGIQI